ncbi:MAG: DUF348 domain-containing protein [Chloroflexi bacterium]|nr:DUF348 domain-containing protein [Chloroflexota bacterium]
MTTEPIELPAAAGRPLVVRLHGGQFALLFLLVLAGGLAWLYTATERAVRVDVNGRSLDVRTHQTTVGRALAEQGFQLGPADLVTPPLDTPLVAAPAVRIWLAQPVDVDADGQVWHVNTQSGSIADVLAALNITLAREDRLAAGQTALPRAALIAQLNPAPLDPLAPREPVRVSVQRAVPVRVSDDGVASTIYTYAATVADLLRELDIRIHPNDRIWPPLDAPVNAGLAVRVERAKPLTIVVDGQSMAAHTREPNISRALVESGIRLGPLDYTLPAATGPVQDNMTVQVVRVREEVVEEASPIVFARLMQGDNNLEIDQQELRQRGQNGEHRKQVRVRYENGREIKRTVEREWDARPPVPQITAYGRKLVVRAMLTPSGPIQYWRVTRMYATSYSPARSGTSPDRPWYGRTSSGLPAGRGVIAVDKSVVPWLSKLYVPGYGIGIAADTGGGVRGRLIDLGFEDDTYQSWHDWVDVYWLAPLPDPETIRWIMPSTPVER